MLFRVVVLFLFLIVKIDGYLLGKTSLIDNWKTIKKDIPNLKLSLLVLLILYKR